MSHRAGLSALSTPVSVMDYDAVVAALAAGQAEGDDDPVADLKPLVIPADLDDFTHAFVTKYIP